MVKNYTRRRPDIRANYEYIPRDEHRLCHGDECRNVIAVWVKERFCSICRRRNDGRDR